MHNVSMLGYLSSTSKHVVIWRQCRAYNVRLLTCARKHASARKWPELVKKRRMLAKRMSLDCKMSCEGHRTLCAG